MNLFAKLISLWRVSSSPGTIDPGDFYRDDQMVGPLCDQIGIPYARVVAGGGGQTIVLDSQRGDEDNVDPTKDGLVVTAFNLVYDQDAEVWNRTRGGANDNDVVADSTVDKVITIGCNYGLNTAGDAWTMINAIDLSGLIASGFGGSGVGLAVAAVQSIYDFTNSNYKPFNGNQPLSVLVSAARTLVTNSADFQNLNFKGGHFIINTSVAGGAGGITPVIQGKDPITNSYYDILVGSLITTAGLVVIKVYPGIGSIANGAASDILPDVWRLQMRVATADSYTYSVGARLVI